MVGAAPTRSCSIPVFQYALENWPPDLYQIRVAHHGPLDPAVPAEAEAILRNAGEGTLNAVLADREDASLAPGALRLEVRFPGQPPQTPPFWAVPWSPAALRQVVDSPVRRRLVEELLGGAAAVFLFLPSGMPEADQAARDRLRDVLAELGQKLRLPPPDEAVAAEGQAGDAAAAEGRPVRFPIVDVPAEVEAEPFLKAMLRASEPGLADLREPMVFPVFGRGRLLYAIVGAGINPDILTEACVFLTAGCSCQIKAQNPGLDLLLAADWQQGLDALPLLTEELPPLTGLGANPPPGPPPPGPPPPAAAGPPPPQPRPAATLLRWTALAGALLLGAVVAGTLVVLRGSRPESSP